MRIDLGKLKFNWKGQYKDDVTYEKDDVVFYDGSSYIFVSLNPRSKIPPSRLIPPFQVNLSGDVWDLMTFGIPLVKSSGVLVFSDESGLSVLPPGKEGMVLTSHGLSSPEWEMANKKFVLRLPNTDYLYGAFCSGSVILSDGTPRSWGDGSYGQLGQGASVGKNRFKPVMPVFPNKDIFVEEWHRSGCENFCRMSDRSIYSWGRNSSGCLGHGHTSPVFLPTKVEALEGKSISNIYFGQGNSSLRQHVLFLSEDGLVYATGNNESGQLGVGYDVLIKTPLCLSKKNWFCIFSIGTQGKSRSFGIDFEGALWGWGDNSDYALGTGRGRKKYYLPTKIDLPLSCFSVSSGIDYDRGILVGHTLALLSDGSVFGWGRNQSGELGFKSSIYERIPKLISSLGDDNFLVFAWGSLSASSLVLKKDRTLRVFGSNQSGHLGIGSMTSTFSPMKPNINETSPIKQILPIGTSLHRSLFLLFENGKLFASGYNKSGTLGLGDFENRSFFEEVPLMNEKIISMCAVGQGASVSIGILTEKGNYYQSGSGTNGQLPWEEIEKSSVFCPISF
ncbi:MAG: hypothetical protein PSN37_04850 [Alphaproteobacteria bacterium]|nr:hypothetical protein [Alphaproteobacteria bacterium]